MSRDHVSRDQMSQSLTELKKPSQIQMWHVRPIGLSFYLTGKSLSEALIFASINPQYVLPMFCACSFHGNSMNNLLSYCGLVDARISASEKDLLVPKIILTFTV